MLWQVDVRPSPRQPDLVGRTLTQDGLDLGLPDGLSIRAARGFLIQGPLSRQQIEQAVGELLCDTVVEEAVFAPVGSPELNDLPAGFHHLVYVLPKPGVMDPVAQSTQAALRDLGLEVEAVRTFRKFWITALGEGQLEQLCSRILANEAIEQVIIGPLRVERLDFGRPYEFHLVRVPIRQMDDQALERLSREGQLYLSLVEMRAIRDYFCQLGRDPTDVELETLAQTWSEHCSHKTLAGPIDYEDENGRRVFRNMLRETIFAATEKIRQALGPNDWCVSVFEDNAGIVRFDDEYHIVFKVETHNHPSAIEPYGGASTGIGGVIRDPLGTGLGAKPICNTDVFCFAPPDTPYESLPPGVLHPRRIMRGVVAGVRDYGNRMGIPTVAGAIFFDPRYLGNPLVYCGNVGLLPRDKARKSPQPGDFIVVVGGRTGRDGIHGATFSSAELTSHSEEISGGAVQIGNPITEKMLVDILLVARDRGLYRGITDCGAGGFSSAVGEMAREIGAVVWLERVPLKYEGLSYTEIWISEAQERMVLAVPPQCWPELEALCRSEGVEATVIGEFRPTGRLELFYQGHQVAHLEMNFLHRGRPAVMRKAVYRPRAEDDRICGDRWPPDYTEDLRRILGSLNVASKHWVIRQYDHEVQGGSVIKPLVGRENDGPSDAAVLRPRLDSYRGIAIACGMNPCYGDFDTYWMAASAIDEAIRNCVAVGADPQQVALLDNFCWGNTDRPETLGSLVRAALACHDMAIAFGTPFISGKDSLNNEFRPAGSEKTICIPPSLLISALAIVPDVRRCVTMDLKEPGNFVYLVGVTRNELGGSHYCLVQGKSCGRVPRVDAPLAGRIFRAMHQAISRGLVRACHDLSEGGLAVAAAEMAFAGGLGLRLFLAQIPSDLTPPGEAQQQVEKWRARWPGEEIHPLSAWPAAVPILLFSESNSRFLVEVRPSDAPAFEALFVGLPCALVGEVTETTYLEIVGLPVPYGQGLPDEEEHLGAPLVIRASLGELKAAWQKPLDW
ncbi:MAG: phosphoribosylformylglycinamidine synthase subunit PurL [Thermoguttaceae bacterium]|nr:phosphoribosylformylglycinamidine synthase subunit PurL [Thermoguttaceae bacterium]MDW8080146.1 phosphoribosylformylglycinamidine synthase subunit PurL [Thermoguttaceae bacterium]